MWEVCGSLFVQSTDNRSGQENCGKRGQSGELPTLLSHMAQAHKSYEYHEVFGRWRPVVHKPTVSTTTTRYIDLYKVSYLPCGKR
jgi:hypothetical protein